MKTRWKLMPALLGAAGGMAQAAFVTIGDAGNAADPSTTYGAVGYEYRISTTEVTIAQLVASGVGSGNENYWNDGTRTVGTAAPASHVSLYEAKKYANYLTEQENGGSTAYNLYSADGTGAGSYTRADAINDNILVYGLPTEDEWYKAAYYTGNSGDLWSLYADGTDTVPTRGTTEGWNYYTTGYVNGSPNYTWTAGCGGEEQNGTYDMMGNVWEWMEDSAIRGGGYGNNEVTLRSSSRGSGGPSDEYGTIGFRVVAVPEPATMGYRRFLSL